MMRADQLGEEGIVMAMTSKPLQILTLLKYYAPGYKAGGPITTVKNSIDHLSGRCRFMVVASDRDLGDSEPYPLPLNEWLPGKAKVMYLSRVSLRHFIRLLRDTEYDVLYLNSFFSFRFSILPMLWLSLDRSDGRCAVLAPRGEFSPGALSIKPFKKKLFLVLAKRFGIYKRVFWQASSREEEKDIIRVFGHRASIAVASDLPSAGGDAPVSGRQNKRAGSLKIVFLSRISRMKNLHFALESLLLVRGDVVFHIYGPIEDEPYWKECLERIGRLPTHIAVEYRGAVTPDDIRSRLSEYHLFYLPTLGEGFGHAIFEAMQAGCPLLISDRTPWNDIAAKGAGFVLPLEEAGAFTERIQTFVEMDAAALGTYSSAASAYSRSYMNDSSILQAHLAMFEEAANAGRETGRFE